MSEWIETKLSTLVATNIASIGSDYPFAEIMYLDTGSITRGKIDGYQKLQLNEAPSRARRLVKENDIIYSTVRPIQRHFGFITSPAENLVVSTGFTVVSCNQEKLNPKYLYYYLASDQIVEELDIIAEASTSTYPSLKPSDIESLELRLPKDTKEQKAIASVLSSLDDKIDLLHRQNKTLEALTETLFRQWFVEEAQEDWEEGKLGDYTDVYRGLSYKGNGLTEPGLGLPMHNLNSVYEGGGYKEAGIKFYSGDYKERHLVKPGDIIVTNTEQGHEFRLIGYPAIVPSFFGETGIFSQHIYRLVPKVESRVTTEYLYYLLMSPRVREQVIAATNGSTVNMLAIDGLQRPEFKLPPQKKVNDFTQQIRLCWKKKEINQAQIKKLEKLRDTLLPKLMSGEVRVNYEQ